uniref:Uncharacterized protein n=1 Tax=Lotus japonicus TaxID=34305 RepID=I3SHC9_LOTJA|nr:unknown [Lotus japonicus]
MGYLLPPRTSSYVGSLTLSFFAANKFAFFELESDEVTALMSIFFPWLNFCRVEERCPWLYHLLLKRIAFAIKLISLVCVIVGSWRLQMS